MSLCPECDRRAVECFERQTNEMIAKENDELTLKKAFILGCRNKKSIEWAIITLFVVLLFGTYFPDETSTWFQIVTIVPSIVAGELLACVLRGMRMWAGC
jgi:hypothetical protein